MYALIENNTVKQYPYGIDVLRRDNPQTSFPKDPTDGLLASWGVLPVVRVEIPTYDPKLQRVEESTPVLVDGHWTQTWNILELTSQELAQQQAEYVAQAEAQRAEAYRTESDPLFFKVQRGEATMEQWLAKVAEIKVRYP
jgi:hypothetical protein